MKVFGHFVFLLNNFLGSIGHFYANLGHFHVGPLIVISEQTCYAQFNPCLGWDQALFIGAPMYIPLRGFHQRTLAVGEERITVLDLTKQANMLFLVSNY